MPRSSGVTVLGDGVRDGGQVQEPAPASAPTREVVFYHKRCDRIVFFHPDRHSRTVVDPESGRIHVIRPDNRIARFEPLHGILGSGGLFRTKDPGMVEFLREKARQDPDLMELDPAVAFETQTVPKRPRGRRLHRNLVPTSTGAAWR